MEQKVRFFFGFFREKKVAALLANEGEFTLVPNKYRVNNSKIFSISLGTAGYKYFIIPTLEERNLKRSN